MLPFGSGTWPLKAEDRQRGLEFGPRYSSNSGKMWWENFVSNPQVRREILDPRVASLEHTECE